jgi:hypothetical protein
MNEEVERDEPLDGLVRALQRPVPIAPGLVERARARAKRQRNARIAGLAVTLAAVVAVGLVARAPGTSVTFVITAPSVHSVALVGDFTDWRSDRVRLEHDTSGQWSARVRLRPGQYRFAYVVDGAEWRADAHGATAPDDFGHPTSILNVAGN